MDTPYTVRPAPGEGLGCFATATISPGTLILGETPLFSVAEPRTNSAVTAAFASLDSVQQTQYLTLYSQINHATEDVNARIIDIFNSNAWQTGGHTSICPLAARFNHSCIPNASFAWNARLGQITVHAIVAIPADTQIKLSYERPYQSTISRRAKLAAYGFTCSCSACSDATPDSDTRRSRMVTLDARIRTGRRQLWRSPVPKAALELVRLLKEEGLVGEALGLAYHDAAVGWRRYGRLDLAVGCAGKELETAVMCFGVESLAVDASMAFLVGLKVEAGNTRKLKIV
ncbi:hypothetical protein G6011_07118 [Alternaria panax]|uniref:SET domain-containing protein n=1 Tax=Alternaria panax TaxID=48097 RepID=A0AAD4I579_9PLEO|nr:hypothetical protein G6011_07118 [Alternaria panax]